MAENRIILKNQNVKTGAKFETERFTSIADTVTVELKLYEENEVSFTLLSFDKDGNTTEIYKENVFRKSYEYSFDPISYAVYRGAVEFAAVLETAGGVLSFDELTIFDMTSDVCDIDCDSIDNTGIDKDGSPISYVTDINGERVEIPRVPKKALFIGNSLVFGMGAYGMCSSAPDKDYFHYVTSHIKEYNPCCEFDKLWGSNFEHSENMETFDKWYYESASLDGKQSSAESKLTNDLDLIFIQLGDNVNTDAKTEFFKTSADIFIERIKTACPRARIIWIYGWYKKAAADAHIEKLCERWGIERIYINSCRSKETEAHNQKYYYNVKEGKLCEVKETWVTHPGDLGMKRIADKIIKKLKLMNA